MALSAAFSLLSNVGPGARGVLSVYMSTRTHLAIVASVMATVIVRGPRAEDVYNILWAVVFGFATLNILSLAARRYDPSRRGLTFGELMAVMVVIISIILLGWEMLSFFHIFPIQLKR